MLVEPPSAMPTAIAFSNASLVMIWRGRMSGREEADHGLAAREREVVAAAVDGRRGRSCPGSDMPIASATDAIVLAVNMPAHEPSVGHARFSISPSSFSVSVPAAHAPTASNTLTMSSAWSL